MKKLIGGLIALFTVKSDLDAQTLWNVVNGKQRFSQGFALPVRDTLSFMASMDSAAMVLRPLDSSVYFRYKGNWRKFATGGGLPSFTNGLNYNGSTVKWGGNLTQGTTINGSNLNWVIFDSMPAFNVNTTDPLSNLYVADGLGFQLNDNYSYIGQSGFVGIEGLADSSNGQNTLQLLASRNARNSSILIHNDSLRLKGYQGAISIDKLNASATDTTAWLPMAYNPLTQRLAVSPTWSLFFPPTPNLQAVTNAGNTTTNNIKVIGNANYVTAYSLTGNEGGVAIGTDLSGSGVVTIQNQASEKVVYIKGDSISADVTKTFQLPNVSGVPVMSVNGVSVTNKTGSITLPTVNIADTSAMLSPYLRKVDTTAMLSPYLRKVDTTAMLSPYLLKIDTTGKWVNDVIKINDSTIRVIKGVTSTDIELPRSGGGGGGGTSDTAKVVIAKVHNATGTVLTRGTVVYLSGATGDVASVRRANNKYDSTSAATVGFVRQNIAIGDTGYVTISGQVSGLNLGAPFVAGDYLYLDSIDGQFTRVKPTAPYHGVFLGVVERANAGNGLAFVKVQNGYELYELHDVRIVAPRNNQVLSYQASTDLWVNRTVPVNFKLGFNNISDYVVNGGSGVQSFGNGTLGMFVAFDLGTALELPYTETATDYIFPIRVTTHEQYGGVANQVGVRAIYASSTGGFAFNQTTTATYVPQTGSNFALQFADVFVTIPKTFSGTAVNYIKFEVIMQRNAGGATSVIGANLRFGL